MHLDLWLAFVAATAILLVIPGPTILAVIGYSVSHGRRARLPLIAAVALGDSTALVVSLLGLGALLATSAFWFTAVKWVGGAYLVYLGIRQLRAGIAPAKIDAPAPMESRWQLFGNTWLVTALNPKGIIFFAAFLPQFVRPDGPIALQSWILAITFVVMAATNAAFYAIFAGTAARLLASPRAGRRFNLVGGSLLTAAGLWALLSRNSPR